MPETLRRILALDAMGVLYAEGNDGQNLLYPFVLEHGCMENAARLIRLYGEACVGKITSEEFWRQAGVDPAMEDKYLLRHRLSEGLIEFLEKATEEGFEIWCLSNDVSEWSRKLRRNFDLEKYFRGCVISGDVGARKPDAAIYRWLFLAAGCRAEDVVFVDDRERNLKAAATLGMKCVLFNPTDPATGAFPAVADFAELSNFLFQGPVSRWNCEEEGGGMREGKQKLLFVCIANIDRSPTAASVYENDERFEVRSAGTARYARMHVSEELVEWADVVFVMERWQIVEIQDRFPRCAKGKRIECLDIDDNFRYGDPRLASEIKKRTEELLGGR